MAAICRPPKLRRTRHEHPRGWGKDREYFATEAGATEMARHDGLGSSVGTRAEMGDQGSSSAETGRAFLGRGGHRQEHHRTYEGCCSRRWQRLARLNAGVGIGV